jgi:hypothetical protein
MSTLRQFRYRCTTEDADVLEWREDVADAADPPTTCRNDTGHTIDTNTISQVDVNAHAEVELANVKQDVEKQIVVANSLGTDGGVRLITHNFCDPCSWWHESTNHAAQATTTSDQLTYDITGHANLIDLRHGRFTFEDDIVPATVAPNGSAMTNVVPTVLLDAVALDQALEDAAAGDDRYVIDYAAGTVTFAVARGGGVAVTVSFRKAGLSKFTIKPTDGKKIVLQDAEVDTSEDVDMTAKFTVDTFGSHSTLTGGAVVSLSKRIYKKMHDFQAAARRFWGPVPSGFGGDGGVPSPKWTFEWQYNRSDALYDTPAYRDLNLGPALVTLNKVEVSIDGDTAYGGCCLTVTMYGYEADEAS